MASPPDSSAPSSGVQSVDRAVRVMEILAGIGEGRVTDLADKLEIHKSTVSRLLATLESHGLVEQDAASGAFRLGYGIVRLAGGVNHAFDLGSVSRPVCVALAREVRETINLVVLDGVHTMCIDQVLGAASVTTVNWMGKRSPTHVAASGKVLLAHLAADLALDDHVTNPLEGPTARSITDLDDLRADLAVVRDRGWADSVDEQEVGLTSVAAPVHGPDGNVVAAVAVSGPTFRLAPARLGEVGAATAAAANRISERTGHVRTEMAD